ncbi:MAG: DUF502 domain-containing protein [Arcobacteraceae bacterium]
MPQNLKQFFNSSKSHVGSLIIKGLFWLAPIVAVTLIILWMYDNISSLTSFLFNAIGFNIESSPFLWTIFGVLLLGIIAYIVGIFVETRLGDWVEKIYMKIPGYGTIKELIDIFNTSKSGENKVLVVLIKGFGSTGHNIGLMYSTKQSVLKDHYTVTLSMTPIPNGGYLFEVHKDKIYVIEEATFDSNLQYLLSMGVKSLAEILKIEPKNIDEFKTLDAFLKEPKA